VVAAEFQVADGGGAAGAAVGKDVGAFAGQHGFSSGGRG
jgi:hypothetical protein